MSKNSEEIAARIDAALAAGTVPWTQPWISQSFRPHNLKSKKPYRGINLLLLAISPHAGRWFVTYRQAEELGGQVRKGEKGTRIFFWAPWCPQTKGGRVDKCAIPEHQDNPRQHHPLITRGYTVFNAETQVDGLADKIPAAPVIERHDGNALAIGLKLVDALDGYELTGGVFEQHPLGPEQAFYYPDGDLVSMPPTETFIDGERYYWGALHELVHSTGHWDRLARHKQGEVRQFGDKDYAREELVAEIGAALGAFELGFEPAIDQTAAYINHWRKALAEDPELITIAAQRASKAIDLLFSLEDENAVQ